MLSLQPHMRILDSFLFLTKAGKSAITMKEKANSKVDSNKNAKIQSTEHRVAAWIGCEFCLLFLRQNISFGAT